jgi:hypothetical protein
MRLAKYNNFGTGAFTDLSNDAFATTDSRRASIARRSAIKAAGRISSAWPLHRSGKLSLVGFHDAALPITGIRI